MTAARSACTRSATACSSCRRWKCIPYETLVKVKEFFEAGGIVVGYGFLPSKSATLGHTPADVAALVQSLWGQQPQAGRTACKVSTRGGRSYFLSKRPTVEEIKAALAGDARLPPTLEVVEGITDNWLHVLHRQKAERDIFLVCNQNDKGLARRFRFRITARGEPECWDAVRGEITSLGYRRVRADQVEIVMTLEPLESVLIVFQPEKQNRPPRLMPGSSAAPRGGRLGSRCGAGRADNDAGAEGPSGNLESGQGGRPVPRPLHAAGRRGPGPLPCFPGDGEPAGRVGPRDRQRRAAGGMIGKPCRLDVTSLRPTWRERSPHRAVRAGEGPVGVLLRNW